MLFLVIQEPKYKFRQGLNILALAVESESTAGAIRTAQSLPDFIPSKIYDNDYKKLRAFQLKTGIPLYL